MKGRGYGIAPRRFDPSGLLPPIVESLRSGYHPSPPRHGGAFPHFTFLRLKRLP